MARDRARGVTKSGGVGAEASGVRRFRPREGKKEEGRREKTTEVLLAREKKVPSRQQALPRRGWVAPRRPRINKTTARPSPVLGPAWPLPAVCLRDVGCPTSRRVPAAARTNPRTRQRRGAAAPRRAPARPPRTARTPARVRNSRRGSISDGGGQERESTGKSAKSARFAEFGGFARKFRDGYKRP